MNVRSFRSWFLEIIRTSKTIRRVKIRFINATTVTLSLMRVIVREEVYEFTNIQPKESTRVIYVDESEENFYMYVVTPNGSLSNFPFRLEGNSPLITQGTISIWLYIEKDTAGRDMLIVVPNIID